MKTKKTKETAQAAPVENAAAQAAAPVENAQAANVYVILNDNDIANVKTAAKKINEENKDFRRQLDVNLMILRKQYAEREETRKHFDYLSIVTQTPVDKFFDIDFVRKLYKVYTYNVLDANGIKCGVYTCISEAHKKTEKTDYTKLSKRAADNVGENLDIAASEENGVYYTPVYNFTAANILRYLLKIDAYLISLANYRTKKKEEARKAKKAAKKAAKNAAQAAPVEETKAA